MSAYGWAAFGLGIFDLLLWVVVIVTARTLWRRVKPMVGPLLQMFLPPPVTSDITASPLVETSPLPVSDRCEYSDHEWAEPRLHGSGTVEHYCRRCGYVEPLPGV